MGWQEELASAVEVHNDPMWRVIYRTDASMFEVEPLAVVLPKNAEEIVKTVQIAKKYKIPLTARGAATGLAGGCLGSGIIVDTSRYLRGILKIDLEKRSVTCQPGVVQDELNEALKPLGFRLGPDTSTGSRATIGGMVGNNSAGAKSLKYGSMVDHIVSCKAVLSNGELTHFDDKPTHAQERVRAILKASQKEIERKFPKLPRRVSGYCLDKLNEPLNLAKLFCGSEGTLGILTEVELKLSPLIGKSETFLFFYNTLQEAFEAVPDLLKKRPVALELIDKPIIDLAKSKNMVQWLPEGKEAMLVMEIENSKEKGITPQEAKSVFEMRKKGLELLLSKRSYERALSFIEDIALPPEQMAPFMKTFLPYLQAQFSQVIVYGHVGAGCMHVRPFADLREPTTKEKMKLVQKKTLSLLKTINGTMSGEHGDGLVRSWLNPFLFGDKIMRTFGAIKHLFDPDNLMNPGKIIADEEPFEHIRSHPNDKGVSTFLDFTPEGGLPLAADLCNGNGLCRKKEGLMCPSFQATHDEFDSTRGRADALRSLFNGQADGRPTKEVIDILDLCLECKGCKKECPSSVDMAKMKAEMLYQYQELKGYKGRLFAHLPKLLMLAVKMPLLYKLANTYLFKKLFKIDTERSLPQVTGETFSSWASNYRQEGPFHQEVCLISDTYTEFLDPSIGQSALRLLNRLGFKVHVPNWSCCGRPPFSKGHLKVAKKQFMNHIEQLTPFKSMPILSLEPSCASMLLEDGKSLAGQTVDVHRIDSFLLRLFEEFPEIAPKCAPCPVLIHTHCHQKASNEEKSTYKLLKLLGFEAIEIPSGCCGMAGSFGYEEGHKEISKKIAELQLLPFLDAHAGVELVACGTSCRSQISHFRDIKAQHVVEFLYAQVSHK